MANVKISELPLATSPLDSTVEMPVVQGGATKRAGMTTIGFLQSGASATLRTVQNKMRDTVSVKDFGAVGNGVTNDTPAIQAAVDSLGAAGGAVNVPNGMRCLVDTNLTIKPNVSLVGPHQFVGSPQDNTSAPYGSIGGTLIINSAVTITLKGGASLSGLLMYRKGMTFPAADSLAFAGTAIIGDGDDVGVSHCMILGFAQAFASSGRQRPRFESVQFDCSSGIQIENCADVAYVNNCHGWPFATIAALGPASSLQRSGTAFKFLNLGDWNKVTDCFAYGYFRGFFVSSCDSMTLLSCSADSTTGFAGQIGFLIDGTSLDTRLIGCQAAAQETGYYINTSAGVQTRMTSCDSWVNANHGVLIDAGNVTISGGIHRNTTNGVTVNSASSVVFVDGVTFNATSTAPIAVAVSTVNVYIGENNYGNWAAGNSVTNNANKLPVSIASADPLNLPANGTFFQVTGTTNFGTINGGWAGRLIVLKFTGVLTVVDGGASIKLAGSFTTSADDTLTLIHDGTAFCEVARSAN